MIDPIAIAIGMKAATRAPNTRMSTIIAAGSPNFSSPLVRSDSESSLKSWSRVLDPVMVTSKSAAESAATTSSSTSAMPVSASWSRTNVTTAACPSSEMAGWSGA